MEIGNTIDLFGVAAFLQRACIKPLPHRFATAMDGGSAVYAGAHQLPTAMDNGIVANAGACVAALSPLHKTREQQGLIRPFQVFATLAPMSIYQIGFTKNRYFRPACELKNTDKEFIAT